MCNIISIILFCFSGIFLLLYSIRKNNNFIDVRKTLTNHVAIFKNKNNKWLKGQLLFFFGLPCTLAIATTIIKPIDDSFLNLILLIITIFISMFFAMLSIIISFKDRENQTKNEKLKDSKEQVQNKKLIKQTCDSLIFENFICVIIILISLIYNLFPKAVLNFLPDYCIGHLISIANFIIYYLLYCLLLNLFIVVKRIRILIHSD